VTVIQDYSDFHQISEALFDRIARLTLGDNLLRASLFSAQLRNNVLERNQLGNGPAHRVRNYLSARYPFKQTFRHALQSREESDAVIIKIAGSDGRTGFGESLPRSYVTGETTETMVARIRDHLAPKIFRQTFAPGWEALEQMQTLVPDWTRSETEKSPSPLGTQLFALSNWHCSIGACAPIIAR